METVVDIRDEALKLSRERAAETGLPLGEVISEAILTVYGSRPAGERRARYDLPVSGEGGLQPGVDLDCQASLEDLMAGSR